MHFQLKEDFTTHLGTDRLRDVVKVLKEVVRWRELFLDLGMPKYVADTIEVNHRGDIVRQKEEAISWWLHNKRPASLRLLADALWETEYAALAEQLYEGVRSLVKFYILIFCPLGGRGMYHRALSIIMHALCIAKVNTCQIRQPAKLMGVGGGGAPPPC